MDSSDLNSAASRGHGQTTEAGRGPRLGLLAPDGLSAVAWVQAELKRSLEAANKTLRRYLRDADTARLSDLDAVEPAVLRSARTQLHQGVGALELVDMPAAAQVLRAAESLVQRMISKPSTATQAAVDAVERVSFALLDYLGRYLAGKPVSPVALFPQYQAALQLAGAERVHPADLWHFDSRAWAEGLRQGVAPLPEAADVPRRADDASRGDMEQLVLGLMREPGRNTCLRMSKLCAELAAGARLQPGEHPLAGMWHSAAAVYEALANGLLANDVHTKRVASRLLAQLRASARGQVGLSERLAQDLIFFCAHAGTPPAGRPSPRLAAVRKAWKLDGMATDAYDRVRLGLHDPAVVASAKRRVAAAKDTWAAVAGDEQHRLSNLMEQFALVGESLQKLFPSGDALAHALSLSAAQTAASLSPPPPPLAMEVATAFLYIDAALEDGELDQADLPERVLQLAQRVDQVRAGGAQRPLESWMEELYRRVSDRQTMGSVVQELRSSLSDVEKHIDQYFRNPADRAPIVGVPGQLASMRGVLSVLGMDHASQAVLHMRDDVQQLLQTDADPQLAVRAGTFNRLADNLGALSFLIDMLSVQPQLAKALFTFDADTGNLSATMGLRERASGFGELDAAAAAPPAPLATPDSVAAPASLAPTAAPLAYTAPTSPATPAPALAAAVPAGDHKLQVRLQALAAEAAQPNLGDHDLLASIDLVAQQAFAADRADLARLLGRAQRGLRDSVDPTSSRAIRADLVRALAEATTPVPVPLPAERPVPASRPTPEGGTGLEEDAEMRAIFIEEARDVTEQALQALQRTQEIGGEAAGDLTTIRRAFHTLKGSARMVGLRDFGEAAWACEQLYNVRLAQSAVPDEALVRLTADALSYLRSWTDAIESSTPAGHDAQVVVQAADALRLHGRLQRIAPARLAPADTAASAAPADGLDLLPQLGVTAPAAAAVPSAPLLSAANAATLVARVGNLPTAADLELGLPEPSSPPVPATPEAEQALDLNLALLPADAAWPAAPGAPEPAPQGLPVFLVGQAPAAGSASSPPTAPVQLVDFEFDLEGAESSPQPADAAVPAADVLELDFADFPEFMAADAAAEPVQPALLGPAAVPTPTALPEPAVPEPALPEAPLLVSPPLDSTLSGAPPSASTVSPAAEPPAPPRLSLVPPAPMPAPDEEENYKRIGPLRISIPLFNIFLNEADELSRRLVNELAEWALESQSRAVPDVSISLAHGLAGSAGTVGCADLSALARALEHALMRSHAAGPGQPGESELFCDTAEEIRRLLHQFAAGFLRDVPALLRDRLTEHERRPAPPRVTESGSLGWGSERMPDEALPDPPPPRPDATPLGAPASQVEPEPAAHRHDQAAPAAPLTARLEGPLAVPVQGPTERPPEPTAAGTAPDTDQAVAAAAPISLPLPTSPAAAPPLVPTGARKDAFDDDEDIDVADSIDADLFPIFDEEAEELLPQLQARLRDWMHQPADDGPPAACMRTLHTFKGGARLAGAMRLGEMAHRLETAIEHLAAREGSRGTDVLPMLGRADAMVSALEALRRRFQAQAQDAKAVATKALLTQAELQDTPAQRATSLLTAAAGPAAGAAALAALPAAGAGAATVGAPDAARGGAAQDLGVGAGEGAGAGAVAGATLAQDGVATPATGPAPGLVRSPERAPTAVPTGPAVAPAATDAAGLAVRPQLTTALVDWHRFERGQRALAAGEERTATGPAGVRVRAALLDRLLNQAGEVTIARSRIDADVKQLQSGLGELGESLERMRRQLRDIEVQAETQISSRLEAAKAAAQSFDPLEMDRFTRLQELTRFMAESVNDVATLQRGLQRTLQSAEDQLAAQSRLTRDLQDDLLRTRMVEFESASDRLYRTVRQAAKEAGKQVRLDIVGGAIELDRGVLERMTGPFEHLLRNCVAHGVEQEAERVAAGKNAVGQVTIAVAQSGNEVAVDIADDGAGLDLQRIRQRAIERRLLPEGAAPTEAELSQLIFKPGFSTADVVTELAGRGVGLDVVRAEVTAMGGRIETQTVAGQGTRFKLLLPLTTAVTQVVMLRCGDMVVAVPSTLIESILRVPGADVEAAYGSGGLVVEGESLPFYWLAALLQAETRGGTAEGRTQAVAVVRSAAQRVAVHIDEVVGNQEVVVKNVGPQLARVPGLAGVTLLPSGAVALIYNPVALSAVYGERLRSTQPVLDATASPYAAAPLRLQPLVMVVDDSLTVRRATERLLVREGYRVVTAKDGMEALELLAGERPVALLSDIEMPRMDGFDLLRNVRADPRLADLPVVMITSRIAHKHREHASELGADHYLGKPYGEDELLRYVARYAAGGVRAGMAI